MHERTAPFILSVVLGASSVNAQTLDAEEVRAAVAEMIGDAETRSSLLTSGDAGHDGKFFIAGDGFRLNVGGAMQFRYMVNIRDEANGDDFESGFQAARTRLTFGGTVQKNWTYFIQAEFDKPDGSGGLLDAYTGYTFENGVGLFFGQVKAPIIREDWMPEFKQLAIERSISTDVLRADRVKAAWLSYSTDNWRTYVTFNSGAGTKNTDFDSPADADYAFSARGEFKFAGNWAQFDDFTSPRGSDFGAMLGLAGYFHQSRNTNNPADVDNKVLVYTADLGLEGDGWNAFGAFIGRHIELDSAAGDSELDDFNVVVQGGVMLTDSLELFARYDVLFADEDRAGLTDGDFNFLTGGVNYYIAGHAAKATADVVYCFDETAELGTLGFIPLTNQGLLGDTEEGELIFRLQFQLMF